VKSFPQTRELALVAAALAALAFSSASGETADGHLVPVVRDEFWTAYRKIWELKLLVSSGDIARFVHFPAAADVQSAVAVYQERARAGAMPGDYWVTLTKPSVSLSDFMSRELLNDAARLKAVTTSRWDAPLPASTAKAINKLWLAMLSQTGPDPNEGRPVDSSTEIFCAKDETGKLREAQAPKDQTPNTSAAVQIGFMLLDYPVAKKSQRSKLAAEIEKATRDLLERVEKH
jgi:hypothetical protein